MKRICLLILFIAFVYKSDGGPIFPSRVVLIHPKFSDQRCDTTSVLNNNGSWGGFSRGYNSNGDRFGWTMEYGVIYELARWKEKGSLFVISGMQVTADTYNNISFNPRGAVWEESMLYAKHTSSFDWQAGFSFRCRHDIDNADPRNVTIVNEQRTCIYGGLDGKIIFKPSYLFKEQQNFRPKSTFFLKSGLYMLQGDFRAKNGIRLDRKAFTYGTDYDKLAFSVGGGTIAHLFYFKNKTNIFVREDLNLAFFGAQSGIIDRFSRLSKTTLDSRTELGIEKEARTRMQLFVGYETFQDDEAVISASNNKYFYIGIRFSASSMCF